MPNDPAIESGEALNPPTVPQDVPVPEPKEEAPEPETKEEAKAVPEEEERPRSGYARQKIRMQRLISQIEAERAEKESLRQKLESFQAQGVDKTVKAPKMQDFTDMEAYDEALRTYNLEQTKRVVAEQLAESEKRQQQARQQESQGEVMDDFFERWNTLESQIPDAKQAVDNLYAAIGPLRKPVRDLIADAENGEYILYFVAQNPGIGRQLNSSDDLTAAKMIGALEERAKLPQSRTQTAAPPPISTPRGGASPPRDIFQTAKKDDVGDYIKMRLAMEKKD